MMIATQPAAQTVPPIVSVHSTTELVSIHHGLLRLHSRPSLQYAGCIDCVQATAPSSFFHYGLIPTCTFCMHLLLHNSPCAHCGQWPCTLSSPSLSTPTLYNTFHYGLPTLSINIPFPFIMDTATHHCLLYSPHCCSNMRNSTLCLPTPFPCTAACSMLCDHSSCVLLSHVQA